jgi:hypothetical protein
MVNTFIGHINSIILLMMITGAGILIVDMRGYDKRKMKKEKKAARFFGWFNLVLGALMWGGNAFLGG